MINESNIRVKPLIGFSICLLITLAVAFHSYMRPYDNWDEIGYVGSAISWSIKSPVDVQNLTFQYIRDADSYRTFQDNIGASNYRRVVYHDPVAFALQLPIYKVKMLYVGLVWIAWRLGFNPARATAVISVIAAAVLGLVVAFILIQHNGLLSIFIYPVILVFGGMYVSGRFSTPDATSALVLFSGLWLLLRQSSLSSKIGLLLLCLSVAIRPDNVILLLFCSSALLFAVFDGSSELSASWILGYCGAGLILWLLAGKLAGYYGWKVMVHHSFVNFMTSPRDLTAFRWRDYTHALLNGGSFLGGFQWLAGSSLGSWAP